MATLCPTPEYPLLPAHSVIGASSAHCWRACPASVQHQRDFLRRHRHYSDVSPYAAEGTEAHALGEALNLDPTLPHPGDQYERWHDKEMLRHAMDYRDYCWNYTGTNSLVMVEVLVKMPRIHDDAFGTADFVSVDLLARHAHVIDFKYGQGVWVDVEGNDQGLMYAEGVRQFVLDYHGVELTDITIHIFQPRTLGMANINRWRVRAKQLAEFAAQAHLDALATQDDEPQYNPGHKQCQWCKAAGECGPRIQWLYEQIAPFLDDLEHDMQNLQALSDSELATWLEKFQGIYHQIKKMEATAYYRALDGHHIPGKKLVAGRASYVPDREAVEFILGETASREPELKSRSQLTTELGKKRFNALLAECYTREPGRPTLVDASDRRDTWEPEGEYADILEDLD